MIVLPVRLQRHRILPDAQAIINIVEGGTVPDNVYHKMISFDFVPDLTLVP
jgi:hypothetical protein